MIILVSITMSTLILFQAFQWVGGLGRIGLPSNLCTDYNSLTFRYEIVKLHELIQHSLMM